MQPYPPDTLTVVPDRASRPLHHVVFKICGVFDRLTAAAPRQLLALVSFAIVLAVLGYVVGELARWGFSLTGTPGHRIPARELQHYPALFAIAAALLAAPLRLVFGALSFAARRAPLALFFASFIPWPLLLPLALVAFAFSLVGGIILTPLAAVYLTTATCLRFALPRSYHQLSSALW